MTPLRSNWLAGSVHRVRYRETGASQSILPSRASCITPTAVTHLLIDAAGTNRLPVHGVADAGVVLVGHLAPGHERDRHGPVRL